MSQQPVEHGNGPRATSRESTLRHEVSRLKRVLVETTLEGIFPKGPCTPSRRDASGAEQLAHRPLIRDVMSRQGGLRIERMGQLAQVSRAEFYRSLQERQPMEAERDVRSAIQGIAVAHRGVCH
jgi:hypothetical protein